MSCCCNYVKKQNNFLIVTPDDFTKASRGCCRACQRLGGVRIQQLLRVTQYDVNGLDSRRRCVKSVNYGLIIFALSCFVGDALSRASPLHPPLTRHVVSTPHHSTPASSHESTAPSTLPSWTGYSSGVGSVFVPRPGAAYPAAVALCSWRQSPPPRVMTSPFCHSAEIR